MEIDEREGTEGMEYFLCSGCGEPVVEHGKEGEEHYFDRRECGCDGGSPKHGWRMLQNDEVSEDSESDLLFEVGDEVGMDRAQEIGELEYWGGEDEPLVLLVDGVEYYLDYDTLVVNRVNEVNT